MKKKKTTGYLCLDLASEELTTYTSRRQVGIGEDIAGHRLNICFGRKGRNYFSDGKVLVQRVQLNVKNN